MDNIVLISAFCNSEEKLNVLRENLQILKSNQIDTAIISPLSLPQDIIELSDYIFITKENPVLDWPERAIIVWKHLNSPEGNYQLNGTVPDYGFSGLNHVKRLGEMFINYDYKHFTFIIYDTIITDKVLKILKKGHDAIVYPSIRDDAYWKVGLHLLSFNKESLKKVIDLISFEEYKKCRGDFDAFAYLHHKIVIPLNITIGDFPIEDKIYYHEEYHNHSPHPDFKYFIHTPDENHFVPNRDYNLKIIFYNILSPFTLDFNINGRLNQFDIKEGTLINLKIKQSEMKELSFDYKNHTYDLTKQVVKLKHTFIKN